MRYVWAVTAAVVAVACCFAPAIAEMATPNRAIAILHQEFSSVVDAFDSQVSTAPPTADTRWATANGTATGAAAPAPRAAAVSKDAASPCSPAPERRGGPQPTHPSCPGAPAAVPERVAARPAHTAKR